MSADGTDHLSEQELAGLASGAVGTQPHLEGCANCRSRLEEIRAAWRLAADAAAPEPPSAYWQAFPRQVRRRLEDRQRRRRLLWLAPTFAAAFALVLALRAPLTPPSPARALPLPAWTPLPDAAGDVGWLAVEGLLRESEDLGADASCRDLGECLAGLSDEESAALAVALRRDLEGEKL
jgi:hypothetical protein